MKTFSTTLLVITLFLYSAIEAFASPAYPGLIKKELRDGTTISLYMKGDEKVHWMESEDGYSLLYDSNRNIVYAISDNEGNMVPSSVIARDISLRSSSDQTFLKGIPKKLNYSTTQINTLKSIWGVIQKSSSENSSQFRSSVGTVKAICALISFPDKPITKTKDAFNNLMNQVGYSDPGDSNPDKGSVHDYYVENSYGKVNLEITVAGPYTVSQPLSYYGANDPSTGSDYITRVHQFATEAANLVFTGNNPTINPSDYDNGKGGIGGFHIIYAGYGEEAGGGDTCIWAHESDFYPALTFGNEQLVNYSCSAELRGNSGTNITHIGVVCHEMGHVLGAVDFYDTSGGSFLGTGNWDLMASGNWNNDGACPSHINMYQKIQFGWVNPTILTQPQTITNMPSSAMNAVAYRYDTSTPGEYFILENRQKTGFDQYVPGNGLLIYRISINKTDSLSNTINTGSPQEVYPICASATTNPTGTAASYGNINSAGCPFPGTSNNTSFTDYTIPSATSWKGANTLKPVTNIQMQNSAVSFKFMMQDATPISNLQATVAGQSVQLKWNQASGASGYNVYRNNILLITLMNQDTTYTQYNVGSGSYSYCVTALYKNSNNTLESSPVCQEVQVTNSSIDGTSLTVQNLTAQNTNGSRDVQLNWQSPFVSDWMTFAQNVDYISNGGTNPFTTAVRFTTDDLQNFYGSKLTQVRFWVDTAQCKYTIQVWLQDPGLTSVPGTPIFTQLVDNPKLGSENVVTLTSPVSLVNNKELWIGIQFQMTNPKAYVAGLDGSSPTASMRNWIYTDNWYYIGESDSTNWDIAGYLQFDNTFLSAPADTLLRSSNATTATATNYVVYRDNVKIATTTQPQYLDAQPPSGNHIYCVSIAYDSGTESEQVCVEATTSSNDAIEAVNPDEVINVFPNPVKRGETLSIQSDTGINSTISLYTISGQLILQEQMTAPVFQKQMNFDPGVYLLKVTNNSKSFIRKIIIK